MPHLLPTLPFALDALEPVIDAATMRLHHSRHHAAYVTQLNSALQDHPALAAAPIEDLLRHIADAPSSVRTAVRNYGGGHANHSLFWSTLRPVGGQGPGRDIAAALCSVFGSLHGFKAAFTAEALNCFGSGWAWLVTTNGTLTLETTANQDSPLMRGQTPLIGLDLWEHAYYLKYQNRRSDYIEAWWDVLDWTAVEQRYQNAQDFDPGLGQHWNVATHATAEVRGVAI